jgi:methylmalonyl-CoA mutase
MGDVQEYFIKKNANFYSVSISGYHIVEAGATNYTITLNGFTM